MKPILEITETDIDIPKVLKDAADDGSGAVNLFLGTVRNKTSEKDVQRLEYEAYDSMAIKEMEKIAKIAEERWQTQKIVIVHRKGILEIGEVAVAIAVSTPHRKASFEACQYIIDTLKETVPIWKKEAFEDGDVWVSAHA